MSTARLRLRHLAIEYVKNLNKALCVGLDKILCKTGLIPINRLTNNLCCILHSKNFEAFPSPAICTFVVKTTSIITCFENG